MPEVFRPLSNVQEIQYDYEHTLECFEGYLYNDYGYYLEDMFELWISDIGLDDGYTQEGGHYYYFAILVEDVTGKNLPTGTYTYSSNLAGDMVFIEISKYLEQGSSSYTQSYLTDGYLNVSADGDIYTIESIVTDTKGATHRIYYNDPAEIWSFALEDLEFTATTATASYFYDDGHVMNIELFFTDIEYDGYDINPPGSYVVLDTYMPYDADGKIAVGTYEVN